MASAGVEDAKATAPKAADSAAKDTSSSSGGPPPPGSIREGLAEVLPIRRGGEAGRKDGRSEVFYNPAQVFNRDLSVLVLSQFGRLLAREREEKRRKREERAQASGKAKPSAEAGAAAWVKPSLAPGLFVLEALAATGIRSIRYAKELGPGTRPDDEAVRRIVANDLDETAAVHIRRNMEHNGVPESLVGVSCDDANRHMYMRRAKGPGGQPTEAYDVIDLDPYGSCSMFLDAAVQSVHDGGLLCITSTDMPVLGGNNPETCFARYGGSALKAGYLHEMALRLVLHAVTTSAARYGREVQPLVSCSIDFYVRVFVRVHDSPARVKRLASKTAVVHQCVQCESFSIQHMGAPPEDKSVKFRPARVVVPGELCPECGGRAKLGGPFYAGPLFDPVFVGMCVEACDEDVRDSLPGITSWRKIQGLLTAISEEHPDLVLYYRLPHLCKGLKLPPLPLRQFRGTLVSLGYKASHFHREPEAIKTDAPNAVVYDLMRLWAEENPRENSPMPELLKKEFTLKRPIEWATEERADNSGKPKVARFLPNPEPNWGPKKAARGGPAAAPESAAPAAEGASEAAAVAAADADDGAHDQAGAGATAAAAAAAAAAPSTDSAP